MQKMRRILIVGDFKDESAKSIRISQRMWIKGLLRLGHDVQRFSYRNIMMQCSPFPSKKIALRFAKKKADQLLFEQIKRYYPDVVFVLSMKYLDAETVIMMRKAAPNAIFVSRDEDPYPDLNPARIAIAQQTDIVISDDPFFTSYNRGDFIFEFNKNMQKIIAEKIFIELFGNEIQNKDFDKRD